MKLQTPSPRELAGMILGAWIAILAGLLATALLGGCATTVRSHPFIRLGAGRYDLFVSPLPLSDSESKRCAEELGGRVIWNIP